ncbi:MAG: dihydropyrimidinase [bacterium]|nr:dihydropyrimidinase [bacterium]
MVDASEATLLIRGGTVVCRGQVERKDVLIQGSKISAICEPGGVDASNVIDAEGLLVLPGAVDTHVHFNDVSMGTVSVHDYYTGTRAAAFGGVTSIVDFSNQTADGTLMQTLADKRREAEGQALIDWGVHPVITRPTMRTLDEIPEVVASGAPTIKCYMTYRDDGLLIDDKDLERIALRLGEAGGMLMLHAEDNASIEANVPRLIAEGKVEPIYHARSKGVEVETAAIRRIVAMARHTGSRFFIVHLASDMGLDLVTQARADGVDITAETCAHYLVLTDDVLKREDGIKWICSPPLRSQEVQDTLWDGIVDGRIAMVTSDDAAYSWEAKCFGAERFDQCPNGIPGIETRLHLLYSEGVAKGRISVPRFVELVAEEPARLFGLAPRKGSLVVGADADVVLFDPETRWTMSQETLHMATDWCAWEGREITGKVVKVISRGELIIDGDECHATKGRGRYICRKLFPSSVGKSP